jgi:hypothetical protein
MGTNSFSQQGYGLATPIYNVQQPPIISKIRGPTTNDQAEIGTIWIWSMGTGSLAWVLGAVVANVATWIPIGNGMGLIAKANDGTTATPAANILNIFGDAVSITTTAAGNTLTIDGVAATSAFQAYLSATATNVIGTVLTTSYLMGSGGFPLTVKFDNGGNFNVGGASAAFYQAPRTGKYFLNFGTQIIPTGHGQVNFTNPICIIITPNGSYSDNFETTDGTTNASVEVNIVTDLTAGDHVTYEVACLSNGVTPDCGPLGGVAPFQTWMSGFQIA